ncbi:MAG: methyltransferase domain-containing protein [Nitrospirae bacterium]|nr:methyltransferase domain-containing protein [Nitrospirota bacterium]
MNKEFFDEFVSPVTKEKYTLAADEVSGDRIKAGYLLDAKSNEKVEISNFIPRFTKNQDYTETFGYQWNVFRKTQLDSSNLTDLSHKRFYEGTKWIPDEMKGDKILEAGCGAGRFTEILLKTGAMVYSFDYSNAVDVCYENNLNDRLCAFQGDIFNIPFPNNYFDRVFCYGVLQHTPNPRAAFYSLVRALKPGGKVSVDCYLKDGQVQPWKSKYIWRPITTKMDKKLLIKILRAYIPVWFPVDTVIKKIPFWGRFMGSVIPCWNYTGRVKEYSDLIEWAVMDTFDALAPKYDLPQRFEDVLEWFQNSPDKLHSIDVFLGGNGIVGNAVKK